MHGLRPFATGVRMLALLWRSIEDAVVPNSCVFCGWRRGIDEAPVCDPCRDDLPWIDPAFELRPFTAAVAPFEFAFPVDAAIRMFKFKRKLHYAPALAHLVADALCRVPEDVDAVLPVPLHWRRQMLRGFNQATEVARPLARQAGLALINNVVRRRATPFQSGLAAAHRRRNLAAAFRVRGKVDAQHVLLVDDVVTTGATCRELGKTLLEAGVAKVSVLAIARVPGGANKKAPPKGRPL